MCIRDRFQHELDHLDGVLLLDHLEREERKLALRRWREIQSAIAGGSKTPGDLALP